MKDRLFVHKIGRLWKFKLSEVDAWVRAGGADGAGLAQRNAVMPQFPTNSRSCPHLAVESGHSG